MKLKILFLTALACLVSGVANADTFITWENSVPLFDAADEQGWVDLQGTSVFAFNPDDSIIGPRDALIGGVNFLGTDLFSPETGGGVTLTTTGGSVTGPNTFITGNFTDPDVISLVGGGTFGAQEVTLSGLTAGDSYRIQIATNDARNERDSNWLSIFSDGVNDIPTSITNGTAGLSTLSLLDPVTGAGQSTGSSVIGTFVAVGTTQSFSIGGSTNGGVSANSDERAQINGIQLRTLGPAVPEPSSAIVLGLSSLILLRRRKA